MPVDSLHDLLDVCSPDGQPLGRRKTLAEIRRDGDWHRSLHLWVVLTETSPASILFRRCSSPGQRAGKMDVTVGAYPRAGETVFDALREAEEATGLRVRPTDLLRLGQRRHVNAMNAHPTQADREVQEVFYILTAHPPEAFCPFAWINTSYVSVAVRDALSIARGHAAHATALELVAGLAAPRPVMLQRHDVLPDEDGYLALVLGSILGAEQTPWSLGRS